MNNDMRNSNENEGEMMGEYDANDLGMACRNEEKNFEMMISGGDYSPNSHTFFKHPFKNGKDGINTLVGVTIGLSGKTLTTK